MSDTRTAAWGPTARKIEPHAFEASTDGNPHWCRHCGSVEDAYAHAGDEERLAFDLAHSPEAEHAARALAAEREWFGYLSTANYAAVAERIRRMLTGNRYTWVAVVSWPPTGVVHAPELRAGMEMEYVRESLSVIEDDKTRPMAHISVSDSYSVWGISTRHASQAEAHEADPQRRVYLHFKRDRWGGDQLQIEHYAMSGNHLWWTIAAEGSGW